MVGNCLGIPLHTTVSHCKTLYLCKHEQLRFPGMQRHALDGLPGQIAGYSVEGACMNNKWRAWMASRRGMRMSGVFWTLFSHIQL